MELITIIIVTLALSKKLNANATIFKNFVSNFSKFITHLYNHLIYKIKI